VTPFTLGNPTRAQRLAVAAIVGLAAFGLVYASAIRGSIRTDFSLTWFGANALLHGANPYVLVGPGRVFDSEWAALYPATAYLLGVPFAFFSEAVASALFVGLSTFALAYGSTRDSWHRLPMFASVAFLSSAHVAQWSILFTAALFIPWLSVVLPAKPQLGIAILAGTSSRRSIILAGLSTIVLVCVSVLLVPTWPREWFGLIRDADQLVPPLLRPGGVIVLIALARWRRPEAWLIAFIAAMPQTSYPYNLLPLLAIAATYREACFLSLTSSAGVLAAVYLTDAVGGPIAATASSAVIIALGYLPAALVVVRRPNERLSPKQKPTVASAEAVMEWESKPARARGRGSVGFPRYQVPPTSPTRRADRHPARGSGRRSESSRAGE
jgi:hypothetical protein